MIVPLRGVQKATKRVYWGEALPEDGARSRDENFDLGNGDSFVVGVGDAFDLPLEDDQVSRGHF